MPASGYDVCNVVMAPPGGFLFPDEDTEAERKRRGHLTPGFQSGRDRQSQDSNPDGLWNKGFASQLTRTDNSRSSGSLLAS